ncbi:FAD:protein FMN transferase [Clostridium butyricum]|uniref:FAD:protein FMN transferase n=1 Tax=Clostridium butyricum TaxID=1492 RepID=UPI0013D4DB9D|nr:FAD:protein FMN transferase [Clostridium butyricum]MCQ2017040.1 FAD:protein FMN transferase [Clostridium butyricum]MCQ2020940.1 FAD:protein FMN transferase [Clostridium butyricum]NFB72082.1 FAD:protein FMN transferase [Clostridium butyricum]NFB90840.1 FAD:protein FMN transferase [Clostridium butyricum]UTY53826.1 FAD:protein FMN transferase [Clostridium butyricum]
MNSFAESSEYIFNTKIYMNISINLEYEKMVLEKASNYMRNLEKKLNFYDENSEISLINRNSGIKFVKVSEDTFNVIKSAKFCSELTNGVFDATIAPLVKKWSVNSSSPKVLSIEEVNTVKSLVNYKDILLCEDNKSVMLARKDQEIDLGGIAKGYIADKIIELYKENGIKSGIINLGGNVKVLGKKSDDLMWNIGIIKPEKHANENIAVVSVEDMSVVTSGAYERAFLYNGKMYHHIINPITGYPAETDLKSITVICKDSVHADALSTPLFIMGKYKAYEFMKSKQISGIMVTDDDKIIITKDLLKNFKLFKDYEVLAF